MSDLAARLRALPAFPEHMPDLDLEHLPEDPLALFRTWLEDAIAGGAPSCRQRTSERPRPSGRGHLAQAPRLACWGSSRARRRWGRP